MFASLFSGGYSMPPHLNSFVPGCRTCWPFRPYLPKMRTGASGNREYGQTLSTNLERTCWNIAQRKHYALTNRLFAGWKSCCAKPSFLKASSGNALSTDYGFYLEQVCYPRSNLWL